MDSDGHSWSAFTHVSGSSVALATSVQHDPQVLAYLLVLSGLSLALLSCSNDFHPVPSSLEKTWF